MLEKFFTKIYSFVLALLFIALVIFFNIMMDTSSVLAAMTFQLLLVTLAIVVFFNLLRVFLSRDRGSYRSMILEKPLFNPKGRPESLVFKYPLYPRFIAVYFDREGDDPYNDEIISIQAVRYENGYLTDGLFLPIKKSRERKRRKLLYFEDAYRYLKTYTRDFPIVIDNKDYASTYLRENLNSMMLIDSVDTTGISRMIYPGLDEYGIEEINDFLRLEVDEDDSLYGAKVVTAIYLDYLRLNKYYTDTTWNPFAKKNKLEPVFPAESTIPEENRKDMTMAMNLWEEDEKLYKVEGSREEGPEDSFVYEPERTQVFKDKDLAIDDTTEDTVIMEKAPDFENDTVVMENPALPNKEEGPIEEEDIKVYSPGEVEVVEEDSVNMKYRLNNSGRHTSHGKKSGRRYTFRRLPGSKNS